MPVNVSEELVIQLFSAGVPITGAVGAIVSTLTVRAADAADTPPDELVAVAA